MGMKLKSGADLCGFELSRFCVQNDVAIPDAPASGRKYFHTGTGMEGKYSLLGRERIYTGTAWRSAAYVDDLANLDLATNADYLALKEKVDLLSGEVDTDAIINNMKEVTAFLEGFAEDANLMEALNKKLDKTGGTISGSSATPLLINTSHTTSIVGFQSNGIDKSYVGYSPARGAHLYNYAANVYFGIKDDGTPYYGDNTLLHEGNVGDYALKTDGSNAMQVGIKFNVFNIDLNVGLGDGIRLIDRSGANGPTGTTWWQTFSAVGSNGGFQFSTFPSHEKSLVFLRTCGNSESSWKDWREIAFTDSNVASAQALTHSNGNVAVIAGENKTLRLQGAITSADNALQLLDFNTDGLWLGYSMRNSYSTYLYGSTICLRTGESNRLIINSSGNVGIGTPAPQHRLDVKGNIHTSGTIYLDNEKSIEAFDSNGVPSRILYLSSGNNLWLGYGISAKGYNTMLAGNNVYLRYGASQSYGLILNSSGNVGIGLTNPSAQLHVNEDIVANGTIACKGVAAEGSAPVGTVDKWAGSIAIGTKSQTYTHGLGTTDITVALYEKNGNEWVQILTDVDIVNANTIRVTFGANTTVEHRIVVMG